MLSLRVYSQRLHAHFGLAFAAARFRLTLPLRLTSRLIMQKARGQALLRRSQGIALPLLVGIRFQVLFHSPRRGSFHLSLTVLVHYRLPSRISPYGILAVHSQGISRVPRYSGACREPACCRLRGCHPLWPIVPDS